MWCVRQTLAPLCLACKQLSERTAAVAGDMGVLRNGFNEWNKVQVFSRCVGHWFVVLLLDVGSYGGTCRLVDRRPGLTPCRHSIGFA